MELNSRNFNMLYGNARQNGRQGELITPSKANSVSFTGLKNQATDIALDTLKAAKKQLNSDFVQSLSNGFTKNADNVQESFLQVIKNRSLKFIKENITEGTDHTYKNSKAIMKGLKENFGDTFDDCFLDIDNYNNTINSYKKSKAQDFLHKKLKITRGKRDKFVYINNENDDLITFHKDPFIKGVCHNIKEFTVGTVLDLCVSLRNGIRKANAKYGRSNTVSPTTNKRNFINRILDNRVSENKARDSFYKVSGVFGQVSDGLEQIEASRLTPNAEMTQSDTLKAIEKNIAQLAKESIGKASKKVGKYNTKSERAWNRLGTGFVSACFASTDFYNISMLQNNDPEQANKSGKKRFAQDMRRQGLTAGITFVVLGALQSKVNKSVAYAVLSLGGVTLLSEILSRLMGGISLTPLSPEEAKKIGEKKATKEAQKQETANVEKTEDKGASPEEPAALTSSFDDKENVFKVFTDKINKEQTSKTPAFTSNTPTENKDGEEETKKKSSVATKILKGVLGAIGISLAIGFLRTKNVCKIDDIIKSMSHKYNDTVKKLTRRRLIMPKDDVDGFLNYLSKNNFNEQHDELVNALRLVRKTGSMTGQSPVVQKYMPKKEINPNGLYYDLGWVESKGKKTAMNLVLYPINTVNKLLQRGNNLVKAVLGVNTSKEAPKDISKEVAVSFVEKYATKYKDALNKSNMYPFRKEMEDAFTRHFSEANSQNKNTSIAMISRFLITVISGYFFVNDYRNEVLIESKGEDVERANATMKERIGHKVANFFLNSMFMDLFNTTFENAYLSSVMGATAVAMATELTNESAVRASICTPTSKMTREELIEYENERLNDRSIKGNYYRMFMKLTGKKPLSEKAKK